MVEFLTVCIGIGTGTAFPVSTVSVQNAVDKAHLGVATGVLTFLRTLGSALGVAMLGAIALGYGLPLGGEAVEMSGHAASATPFAMIFFACAATMLAVAGHAGANAREAAAGQGSRAGHCGIGEAKQPPVCGIDDKSLRLCELFHSPLQANLALIVSSGRGLDTIGSGWRWVAPEFAEFVPLQSPSFVRVQSSRRPS